MKHMCAFIFLFFTIAAYGQQGPEVPIIKDFTALEEQYFNIEDGKTHVINFWATWCKPCVAELPFFDQLTSKYSGDVKVTLVSLDFPRKMDSKLIPFITKHQLQSEVVLLDDGNVNVWIDKVDPSWSGAIPATVVFKNGKKRFYEKQFHSMEEVEKIILNINN